MLIALLKSRTIFLQYVLSDALWNSLFLLLTNLHYCRALKPRMFIVLIRFHARVINCVSWKKGLELNMLCSDLICCCYPTHGRLAYKLFLLIQKVLVLWLYLSYFFWQLLLTNVEGILSRIVWLGEETSLMFMAWDKLISCCDFFFSMTINSCCLFIRVSQNFSCITHTHLSVGLWQNKYF